MQTKSFQHISGVTQQGHHAPGEGSRLGCQQPLGLSGLVCGGRGAQDAMSVLFCPS